MSDMNDIMEEFLEEHNAEQLSEKDEEGMQFLVLFFDQLTDDRPIVLWVHPGDACEHDADDEEVRNNAHDFEHYMGEEIMEKYETHRIVVLHRQSTPYAFMPGTNRVADAYWEAMTDSISDNDSVHLWGDDLEKAAQWVIKKFPKAPSFFLTGAWSDPQYGCVTAMGKSLLKANKEVEVSSWSPSEPGSVADTWRPEHEKEAAAKAERKPSRRTMK